MGSPGAQPALITYPFIYFTISGEFPWRPTRVAGSACRTCSLAHTSPWTGGAGAEEKVGPNQNKPHFFFPIIKQRLTVMSSYSVYKSFSSPSNMVNTIVTIVSVLASFNSKPEEKCNLV